MSLTQLVAKWQKSPLYADLTTAINTAYTTGEFKFRNMGVGFWPDAQVSLEDHGLFAGGVCMRQADSLTAGRPTIDGVTLEHPLTKTWAGLVLASLMQNKTFSTNKYVISPYTDSPAKWFLGMETGYAETGSEKGIWNAHGYVARKVKINLPVVGADGGKATIGTEFIGRDSADADAATSTAGAADTDAPLMTKDFALTIGGAASSFVSADITLDTKAAVVPSAAALPEAIQLGDLEISGNLTLLFDADSTASLGYTTARAAQKAGTALALVFTHSSFKMTFSAKLGPSGPPSEQGNSLVVAYPITGVYVGVASPQFEVAAASDIFASWT